MNLADLFFDLLYPNWPIAGLIIGALLPPLFYPKRRALALCLNVAGFLYFAIPYGTYGYLFGLDALLCRSLDGIPLMLACALLSILLTLAPFIGLEWLVWKLCRALRQQPAAPNRQH